VTFRKPFRLSTIPVIALFLLLAPAIGIIFSGCLTAEKKGVHIKLNPDGKSGSGSILFSGISSSPGDSSAAVTEDFNTLIAEYYQGRKIEEANPGMKNVRKKLFKENGELVGKIEFDFDDVSQLGIFRYKNSGPMMFYTVSEGFLMSGQYESSNGTYMGDKLPVIFWDSTQTDLYYSMTLSSPQEPKSSLLAKYDQWQVGRH
jgi:hypothetical protein